MLGKAKKKKKKKKRNVWLARKVFVPSPVKAMNVMHNYNVRNDEGTNDRKVDCVRSKFVFVLCIRKFAINFSFSMPLTLWSFQLNGESDW